MHHLKDYLDSKVEKYNCLDFITLDPISIPHKYSRKEDIEIAGFLCATIAWGNRKAILKSANQWMQWMDNAPYDFIANHTIMDLKPFEKFVYRTFNGKDCIFFIQSLQNIYLHYGGIESVFNLGFASKHDIAHSIAHFRNVFFNAPHEPRSTKHIANPQNGSSAKRINMFLRWMVRKDTNGVDFGLWQNIRPADLMIPLDVHSGTIARKLELLNRKQDDWKSVLELTQKLRKFDTCDPVKYDFALFGLGVNNDF